MAKTKISEFSATPSSNTDIDGINIAEGCAPSGINNAIRELMSQLKDFQTGAAGDSFNGPVGTSTAAAGAFTNLSASGTLGVTGVATLGNGAILGTPASVTLTNATGLPIATGVSGLGTGVATALAVNVGSAGAPVVNGGALGTPSSGTVTNLTGTASININGTVGATTASTGAFTTLTTSSTVTHNGGTANGVAYLNGSKVLTTGSALTFDGSSLSNTRASGAFSNGSFITNIGSTSGVFSGDSSLGLISIGSYSNHPVAFYQNNAEQMRLTSTGLGIGTSSPGAKLEVDRNTTASASATGSTTRANSAISVAAGSDTNTRLMFGIDTSTNGWIQAQNTSSSGTASIILNPVGGNLGLGVTPSAWSGFGNGVFEIGGNTAAFLAGAGNQLFLGNNAFYNGTNWIYKRTAGATYAYQVNGQHAWFTAPSGTAGNAISFSQAMTLTAAGNLGLGTTSPTAISGYTAFEVNGNTSGSIIDLAQGDVMRGRLVAVTGSFTLETSGSIPILFSPGGSERARIDSSGNLLIGTTTVGVGNTQGMGVGINSGASYASIGHVNGTASGSVYISFGYNGGAIGNITQNGTAAVAYNTSSDYRLKNTIAPMTGALAKVALLKPCTYKWNADGSDGEGFIAHELAEVVPQCVTGEKDAVDAEGKPQYQGIDTSFLVATLTAAIQELKAEFDAYKASHP
jgi:hypothetical protein